MPILSLQPEPAISAEAPVDPAIASCDAGDMAPELLFEGGRPGHELEAQAVVDHGEAAGGEREALAVGASDIFARCGLIERLPGLSRKALAQGFDLSAPERADQILGEDDSLR